MWRLLRAAVCPGRAVSRPRPLSCRTPCGKQCLSPGECLHAPHTRCVEQRETREVGSVQRLREEPGCAPCGCRVGRGGLGRSAGLERPGLPRVRAGLRGSKCKDSGRSQALQGEGEGCEVAALPPTRT